jgi:hypothetical protein
MARGTRKKAKPDSVVLEIGNLDVFTAFLGTGFLPEVLPPIFDTHQFSRLCSVGKIEIDPKQTNKLERVAYNCTKRGHNRRIFDVMHPASAALCSAWLSRHWEAVTVHCNEPKTTATDLELSNDFFRRSISTAPFDVVQRAAKTRTARARHFIRADIAKFYPSIYTHSLPWALHGKGAAKNKTKREDPEIFANHFDWALRAGQSGQTKGIPIGPDISRVAAEIIGAAVDRVVMDRCRTKIVGYVRNIDDFYIGCANLTDAEAVLTALSAALRDFELSLNDEKTHIQPAQDFYDDDWAVELDSFLASSIGDRSKVIDRAFDRTFLYASKNRADSALKFLIRMVDKEITAKLIAFDNVQHDLIRAFVNFPHCIDYVMTMLFVRAARGEDYDRDEWKLAINEALGRHSVPGHDHEICWLLTAAYICNLEVVVRELLSTTRNPLNVTLLYLLKVNGLFNFDLNEAFVPLLKDQKSSSNWLLAHEGIQREWFPADAIGYDYRAGLESFFVDGLTFLDDSIVEEFSKVKKSEPSIPDRYERYDELSNDGYIEFLVRQQLPEDSAV